MNRFEELTEKYLDEVLSPSEGRELANHLGAEPEAARQFLAFYSQDRVLIELFRSEDLKAIESMMAEIRVVNGIRQILNISSRCRSLPKSGWSLDGAISFKRCKRLHQVPPILKSPGRFQTPNAKSFPVSSSRRSKRTPNRERRSDEIFSHSEGTQRGQVAGHAGDRRGSHRGPPSTPCTARSTPTFAPRRHRPNPWGDRHTS